MPSSEESRFLQRARMEDDDREAIEASAACRGGLIDYVATSSSHKPCRCPNAGEVDHAEQHPLCEATVPFRTPHVVRPATLSDDFGRPYSAHVRVCLPCALVLWTVDGLEKMKARQTAEVARDQQTLVRLEKALGLDLSS